MNKHFTILSIAAIIIFSNHTYADFENLGKPVKQGFLLNYSAGPDADGNYTKLYFAFHQPLKALLVEVTPGKRQVRQFTGPEGIAGPWGFTIGKDNKIYLGCSGHILVFDPKEPEKQLVDLGKPVESETMIWRLARADDGTIYGSTYPNCKLVSYDPQTGLMTDLGRLDPNEEYARPITIGCDGWIYVGVGPKRGNVTAYNPKTKEMKPILSDDKRPNEWGRVGGWYLTWKGRDGFAYGEIGDKTYKFLNGEGIEISADKASAKPDSALADGRELTRAKSDGSYGLKDPKTQIETKYTFDYSPNCPDVFLLANGPDGLIYGSTITPLVAFSLDPNTKAFKDLGKVTESGGEVYSFAAYKDELFICSYPEAKLSRYKPAQPARYGTTPQDNPFDYGAIGAEHSRPRAMVTGADGNIYISGYPNYGKLGAALSVYSPQENKIIRHSQNIIHNQSVISLAGSDKYKLIFGGSSVTGGNGIDPTESEAHFFVWDTQTNEKTVDIVPVSGHKHIVSVCCKGDKVFMITAKEHSTFGGKPEQTYLAVFDIPTKKVVFAKSFDFGRPVDTSLGLSPDGSICGLTDAGIFRIDTATFEFSIIAKSPVKIDYGFAVVDKGIYFASGADVWRYNYGSGR